MSWVYDYSVGPPGGSLTSLLTYCSMVRIDAEWSDGYRGSDPIGQYQHGEVSSPRKFHPGANFNVEVHLLDTNSSGTVTHADGRAGHLYENFSAIKALFAGGQDSLVRIERDAPDQGAVYLDCFQVGRAAPIQDRLTYSFPMRAPHPFWVGAADTGNSPPTLTVAGDAPIDDMVIDFTGGTDARLTRGTDYIEIVGAVPAGGVRVDVGAGTCVRITGGTDYSNNLRVYSPWWMELDPGANTVSLSGGGSVSVDWYTKWR